MMFNMRIAFLAMGSSVFATQLFGCGDLTVPVAPGSDASTAPPTTDGGTTIPPSGVVPSGAKVGETKDPGFNAGTVSTWAVLDASNVVTEVAFSFPMTIVRSVSGADQRFAVLMPKEAIDQTQIKSLAINYYQNGHIPPGVYDTPHWEIHGNNVSEEEVQKITCDDPSHPPPELVPKGYIVPPIEAVPCLPLMGIHAISGDAPEFNGERFRAGAHLLTFYKGAWRQHEPKASVEFMKRHEEGTFPLPDMPKVPERGLYPRKFSMNYNAQYDTYVFKWHDFIMKE